MAIRLHGDGRRPFGATDVVAGVRGGPAPVREYLPDLIDRVLSGRINPGKAFDLELPLSEVAEATRPWETFVQTLLTLPAG